MLRSEVRFFLAPPESPGQSVSRLTPLLVDLIPSRATRINRRPTRRLPAPAWFDPVDVAEQHRSRKARRSPAIRSPEETPGGSAGPKRKIGRTGALQTCGYRPETRRHRPAGPRRWVAGRPALRAGYGDPTRARRRRLAGTGDQARPGRARPGPRADRRRACARRSGGLNRAGSGRGPGLLGRQFVVISDRGPNEALIHGSRRVRPGASVPCVPCRGNRHFVEGPLEL
jgi:hypothetical protein